MKKKAFKVGDKVLRDHPFSGIVVGKPLLIMAISGRYAMVRAPRCMPFVEKLSELRPIDEEKNG